MNRILLGLVLALMGWMGRSPVPVARPPVRTAASTLPAAPQAETLPTLLGNVPGDSLAPALRGFETMARSTTTAAEAAQLLGRFHLARGDYREAIAAFARAAARLDPARKAEARYEMGLAWLGLEEPSQARAVLEEVAGGDGPRRGQAGYALAESWMASGRPDRALESLRRSLADGAGECTPAVLDRMATLAEDAGHAEEARLDRERIVKEWPRSIEAARARLKLASVALGDGAGRLTVVIGSFVDPERARALAREAQRAGFPGAVVVSHGEGLAAVYDVRLGNFLSQRHASASAEQAQHALGLNAQVVKAR